MFDPEESLTHEEILLRFKKLFNRDMTAAEKLGFFLPSEPTYENHVPLPYCGRASTANGNS
jgi:hypothetical protein